MSPKSVNEILGTLEEFAAAVRVDPSRASSLGPYLFAELAGLAFDRALTERLADKIRDDWDCYAPPSPQVLAVQFHRMLVAALVALAEESSAGFAENATMPTT